MQSADAAADFDSCGCIIGKIHVEYKNIFCPVKGGRNVHKFLRTIGFSDIRKKDLEIIRLREKLATMKELKKKIVDS